MLPLNYVEMFVPIDAERIRHEWEAHALGRIQRDEEQRKVQKKRLLWWCKVQDGMTYGRALVEDGMLLWLKQTISRTAPLDKTTTASVPSSIS